jgi:cytochrome c oxidase cbb3-type subunit 4
VETILPVLKQFWVVWLMLLFVGIVAWVYWPGRRREMEDNARIPFRDEEGGNGRER